jgi:hypothetical protein
MIPLDYGRSFLIGNAPDNEVRFWAESRTRIIDESTGCHEDYVQTGSCKSEHTFASENLFHEDNYDFLPIFGPQYSVIFRRKAYLNDNYKDVRPSDHWWNGQTYTLVEGKNVEELKGNAAILQATYDNFPLVSQTEIRDDSTQQRAIIECPIKTMNTIRAKNTYQVDTGPVAFPDLSTKPEHWADHIALAFVAFNVAHFADFVIEAPTAVGQEMVYHYSKLVTLEAENRIYAVKD